MTSLPSIMHCMESLPKHLRLYGITIVLTSALVFNVWFWFFVRLVSFSIAWSHFMVAVGILVACLLHIRFAPPSIMHTLFNLDTVVLHKELKRWVPEDQLINIDDLVDHVLYRGPVFSSEMNAFAHLSQLGVFVRKTIICALLLPLGRLLSISAMTYEHRHISSGEFEGSFISTVITLLGYVITVVMNVKLGRRCTLAVAFVSAIFAQMTLLCTRMDMYNACWKMNTPKGWRTVLAYLAYTLTIISASIITVTARLTLVEHVPTSVRSIVAVAYFFSVFFCVSYLGYLRWLTLPKTYPNSTIIHSLGFTLMVAPFSLFIDNSDYLPISSSEIPAYSVPNRGYPVDQQPSDEPSEHMSARMMLDACAAAELTTEGASSTANE